MATLNFRKLVWPIRLRSTVREEGWQWGALLGGCTSYPGKGDMLGLVGWL